RKAAMAAAHSSRRSAEIAWPAPWNVRTRASGYSDFKLSRAVACAISSASRTEREVGVAIADRARQEQEPSRAVTGHAVLPVDAVALKSANRRRRAECLVI